MRKQIGLTLIELMVVVAILGVLSAFALPAFQTYSDRTRRAENCKSPLLEIAVEMETFRAANGRYPPAGIMSVAGIPYDDVRGEYTLEVFARTDSTYTLRCRLSSVDIDSDCGPLTYDNFGRKGAPSATNGRTAETCWN